MPHTEALYPGTFDCLTYGHIDLIERCSKLFPRLTVAVAMNSAKKPIFSVEERLDILQRATEHLGNVRAVSFSGLTVDFARQNGIKFIIRGLRAVTDFESELQMALMNQCIAPEVETIFLAPSIAHAFVSSSLTKEIVAGGGDVSSVMPDFVAELLRAKLKRAAL